MNLQKSKYERHDFIFLHSFISHKFLSILLGIYNLRPTYKSLSECNVSQIIKIKNRNIIHKNSFIYYFCICDSLTSFVYM